jgi:hypothetical protein
VTETGASSMPGGRWLSQWVSVAGCRRPWGIAPSADSALHVDDGFLVAARHIVASYGVACLEVCGGAGMALVSSSSSSARRARLPGACGSAHEEHVSSSAADDRPLGHSDSLSVGACLQRLNVSIWPGVAASGCAAAALQGGGGASRIWPMLGCCRGVTGPPERGAPGSRCRARFRLPQSPGSLAGPGRAGRAGTGLPARRLPRRRRRRRGRRW